MEIATKIIIITISRCVLATHFSKHNRFWLPLMVNVYFLAQICFSSKYRSDNKAVGCCMLQKLNKKSWLWFSKWVCNVEESAPNHRIIKWDYPLIAGSCPMHKRTICLRKLLSLQRSDGTAGQFLFKRFLQ